MVMAPHIHAGAPGSQLQRSFSARGSECWEAQPFPSCFFDLQTAESELQNWSGELEKPLEFLPAPSKLNGSLRVQISSLVSFHSSLDLRGWLECLRLVLSQRGSVVVHQEAYPALLCGRTSAHRARAGGKPCQGLVPTQWGLSLRHSVTVSGSGGLQTWGRPGPGSCSCRTPDPAGCGLLRMGALLLDFISSESRYLQTGTWALVKEASLRPSASSWLSITQAPGAGHRACPALSSPTRHLQPRLLSWRLAARRLSTWSRRVALRCPGSPWETSSRIWDMSK